MDPAIIAVLTILAVTVIALVFELVRVDVVALLCMLALGWTGVLTPLEAVSGFSSNAVIAMMGVMVLGRGIARTGLMERFSRALLRRAGLRRWRLLGLLSLSVGLLSGFIQNIGAAALFLPGIVNVSRRGKIPAGALVMPVGFAAILGGTLTMVGSGPLILINDLLLSAGLAPYGLFSVTPVGVLLLLSGVAFFLLLGRFVLPDPPALGAPVSEQEKLVAALHLPHQVWHYLIPSGSALAGQTTEQSGAWDRFKLHVLGVTHGRDLEYAPWRGARFEPGQELALLGGEDDVDRFAAAHGLVRLGPDHRLGRLADPEESGFAEVIIPPRSEMVGQTMRQFALRRRYAVEPVLLFSKGAEIWGDFSDHRILPGDTIIVHGLWENVGDLKASPNFVVVTPFQAERKDRAKTWVAVLCFLGVIGLALAGAPIALAFFSGAVAMVLVRVLTIQEAYQAIEWKAVFLLAGLVPLGMAMQKTGAAAFLAQGMMALVQGGQPILIVLAVAILSTLFSLVMSNVGAIVVLAPLAMDMAAIGGLDPRAMALLAAVCTANSFILPTHQVNMLLMSSGGYRNRDYLKAGGGMTVLFLLVVVTVFHFCYL